MIKDQFFITLQKLLPQATLSRFTAKLANCENKRLKDYFISIAMRKYDIDLSQAIKEHAHEYSSFNDFFTRKLKPDARPICMDKSTIISPADGKLTQFGSIEEGQLFQAKGKTFSLDSLTANTHQTDYGDFGIIYLSPKDYHRVHMPINGTLTRMCYIPGKLYSVNELTAQHIDGLFSKNERLVCYFDTAIGEIAIIFVGAMLVAGIVTDWHGLVAPSYISNTQHFSYEGQNIHFNKGDEIGYFNFGSTIITLFPQQQVNITSTSLDIQMGQALAKIIN